MESPFMKQVIRLFKHDLPEYAEKSTQQLGEMVMNESGRIIRDSSLNRYMVEPNQRMRILINMAMDIEMAHYEGYEGKPVYQMDEKGEVGYWKYEKVGKREWIVIDDREYKKIMTVDKQLRSIQTLFTQSKGMFLTFFPLDPRHWLGRFSLDNLGTIIDAFNFIIQISKDKDSLSVLSAIGFKLYSALGFRPDDYKDLTVFNKGPISQKKVLEARLPDLRGFYAACTSNKIPITCHCSRGGVFAHDFMLYYDYLFPADDVSEDQKKEYFYDYYVSPFAWERVLKDFPDLHLCLAHFGGEEEWERDEGVSMPWAEKCIEMAINPLYPNFYVDLSYFTFKSIDVVDCSKVNCDTPCVSSGKRVRRTPQCPQWEESVPAKEKLAAMIKKHPKLKQKILFGTDWYLIGSEKEKHGHYDNYFKRSIETLAEIDPELPAYAMIINPKRFLDLEAVTRKIAEIWGKEYVGLRKVVSEKMHDSIEEYYV
jgi:hypothetical protein